MPCTAIQRMSVAVCLLSCILSQLECRAGHDLFTQLVVSELVPTGLGRTQTPVSLGIPLPQTAELQETDSFVLVGSQATQFRILNRWPNQGIRWLAIDALIDLPSSDQSITLQLTTGQAPSAEANIASEEASTFLLNSGPVKATLSPASTGFLSQLAIENTPLLQASPLSLSLGEQPLSSINSSQREFSIEENGPVKAIVSVIDRITYNDNEFSIFTDLRSFRHQTKIEIDVSIWASPSNDEETTIPHLKMHLPFPRQADAEDQNLGRHTFHSLRSTSADRAILLATALQPKQEPMAIESTEQSTTLTLHAAGSMPPGTLRRTTVILELRPTSQSAQFISSPIIGRATSIESYNDANILLNKLLTDSTQASATPPDATEGTADLGRQATDRLRSFLQAIDESYVDRYLPALDGLESLWRTARHAGGFPGEAAALWPLATGDVALRRGYHLWGETFRDRVSKAPEDFQTADALTQLVQLAATTIDPAYKNVLWKILTPWLLNENSRPDALSTAAEDPELLSVIAAIIPLETASSPEEERLLDLLESLLHQTPPQSRSERWYYEAYLQSGDPEIIRQGQAHLDRHPNEPSENLRHLILAPLRYRIWRPLKITPDPDSSSGSRYRWTVPARAERYRFKQSATPLTHSFLDSKDATPAFHQGRSVMNKPRPSKSGTLQSFALALDKDDKDTNSSPLLTAKYLERGAALPAPEQDEAELSTASGDSQAGSEGAWLTSGRLLQIAVFAIIVATCLMFFNRKRSSSASNLFIGFILLLITGACSPTPDYAATEQATPPSPSREAQTQAGNFKVHYTPAPDPIPLNEHFQIEVRIDANEGASPATKIEVDADMPAHGHGINTAPTVESHGDGKFTVEGLLFHMKGDWELYVDILDGPVRERATFPISL